MKITLFVLTVILVLMTLLPLVKSDYWYFRVFDYPRLQKFFFCTLFLVMLLYFFDRKDWMRWMPTLLMTINVIYLFVIIFPYTVLGKKQVLKIENEIPDQGISLLISNVYQDNDNYSGCLDEIAKVKPDVILLLEANQRWKDSLALEKEYPHSVTVPLENTYGMLLYSKLPLEDAQVKYLVEKDIPSIHTKIVLRNGQEVRLFAVHPTPPVPQENPRATERDKELLLVADLAKKCKLPVIVAGDLNDVAWSHTTRLFLRMSEMLDPRRGRGFFNSFHAHYLFLRFPLDHAFISTDFKLKELKRMDNYGSDHFPIYVNLQYEEIAPAEQKPMKKDSGDVKEAEEKKAKA
jgi:endonuclease/exonuclease/phosphatase (EEP) superfamily protein YafD